MCNLGNGGVSLPNTVHNGFLSLRYIQCKYQRYRYLKLGLENIGLKITVTLTSRDRNCLVLADKYHTTHYSKIQNLNGKHCLRSRIQLYKDGLKDIVKRKSFHKMQVITFNTAMKWGDCFSAARVNSIHFFRACDRMQTQIRETDDNSRHCSYTGGNARQCYRAICATLTYGPFSLYIKSRNFTQLLTTRFIRLCMSCIFHRFTMLDTKAGNITDSIVAFRIYSLS